MWKFIEYHRTELINIIGPLSGIWMEVNSMKNNNASNIDFHSLNQALQQTIVLIGQSLHCVAYHRRNESFKCLI